MNFTNFTYLCDVMRQNKRPFMQLRVLVEDIDLRSKYETHINAHNQKIIKTIEFPDSGFDLITPYLETNNVGASHMVCHRVNKLDFRVKCSAVLYDSAGNEVNTGYYLYPRSSISKLCIRLANSVGIIDAGYRGNICAMVDVVYADACFLDPYEKLFQICAPGLVPIVVELVNDLGVETVRGEGGFGSTNK